MQKEINRLLKLVNVEKLKKNHRECIDLYNRIGGIYSDVGSYDEAVHYHEEALKLCLTIGDSLGIAQASRYIGESKASLGQFFQAIEHIKKYLELAEKLNNKVEIQRAWTTLGRVYLMQAQEMKDNSNVIDDTIKRTANEAQKTFKTALRLAESVQDEVDDKEYAQMNSSLLNNLALIDDICGKHNDCVVKFNRAIEICKKAKLKEDLYRCQIILTSIFRKKGNVKMAVRTSEEALKTAKSDGKKLLVCDAYIECGLVKISQRDFKNAKRTFAQAYLEKSPNEDDHLKAIKLTKLAHLMSETFDKISDDNIDSENRVKLCDKMGDLLVATEHYRLATEYYTQALSCAKVCQKPKSELARILYSIAETFADDGQFEHALECYKRELRYRSGNEREECQSLMKIAQMLEYLDREPDEVCSKYEEAYKKTNKDPKLMYTVLKDYISYMKKKGCNYSRLEILENDFLNLKSYSEVQDELGKEGEEEIDELEDEIANIDDIISDDDDNDEVMMVGRRRTRGIKKFKANEVGDTPLHEASIKGDLKRVKSLINQGHDINPRDNAGWIPLHEACNHGHYDIAEYLIENGADVNNRGLKGMSPLHDAATNGHFEIMRLLIQNGANVIALTDTGETVLGCLRDYKRRNYDKLSNREASEYKQIESELLNIMDKRGFNLMEANIKTLGSKSSKNSNSFSNNVVGSNSNSININTTKANYKKINHNNNETNKETTKIPSKLISSKIPAPKSRLNVLQSDKDEMANSSLSDPVKEYRKTIGSFKRKRTAIIIDDDDEEDEPMQEKNERISNLPATYETHDNTSAPTKQWLIDDISRNSINSCKVTTNKQILTLDDWSYSDEENKSRNASPELIIEDSSDDNEKNQPPIRKSTTPTSINLDLSKSCSSSRLSSVSLCDTNLSNCVTPIFNMNNPLVVYIDDRKLLIPIKDDKESTIKWLKKTIIERYSVLVGNDCKPNISLVPLSDSSCYLYDEDLCKDVIRENLIANIDSWQLDTVTETYIKSCEKFGLDPMNLCINAMKKIDNESKVKLDLSFNRFPTSRVQALSIALARRDYIDANLTSCPSLFETDDSDLQNQHLLLSIGTWKKLKYLNLTLNGLLRRQFEIICTKWKLPELETLVLDYNCIYYKTKSEFKNKIESLLKNCPKLNKIDLNHNDLHFIFKEQSNTISTNDNQNNSTNTTINNDKDKDGLSNLISMLDLSTNGRKLTITGNDQNNVPVYTTAIC